METIRVVDDEADVCELARDCLVAAACACPGQAIAGADRFLGRTL
jgi:hypothetical protein